MSGRERARPLSRRRVSLLRAVSVWYRARHPDYERALLHGRARRDLRLAWGSGYRRIGLRYVLSGSYETLVKFLVKLEAATPPLVIDNLHIHGVLRRPGTPAAAGLDAGLDVYAFRDGQKSVAATQ